MSCLEVGFCFSLCPFAVRWWPHSQSLGDAGFHLLVGIVCRWGQSLGWVLLGNMLGYCVLLCLWSMYLACVFPFLIHILICFYLVIHKKVLCAYSVVKLSICAVSYTHLRAHETDSYLVCRLLLEKKMVKCFIRLQAYSACEVNLWIEFRLEVGQDIVPSYTFDPCI